MERLAAANPSDSGLQRDVLVSYSTIGDALVGLGNVEEALEMGRSARCGTSTHRTRVRSSVWL